MKDTLEYLYALRNQGSHFGIERMSLFAKRIGNPQTEFPVIHVAGTNGKGSVCAMLDAVYRENGYKVGLFSSPHLVQLGERIRINGMLTEMEEISSLTSELMPVAKEMESERAGMHPTFFEFMTAMAFLRFRNENVDVAVLETGLGGRLDSTNIVNPILSVITTISYDHCDILGHEIAVIAAEKGGIVKQGRPVLTGWLPPVANKVIREIARKNSSPFESLASCDPLSDELPRTNLFGKYQRRNAALAQRAVGLLSESFPVDACKTAIGLNEVILEARWQVLPGRPMIILDACHNEEGAEALRENLSTLGEKVDVWLGSLGQSRASEVISAVLPSALNFKFFQPNQPRACLPEELMGMIPGDFEGRIDSCHISKVGHYLRTVPENRIILITGSIYLIGEFLSLRDKSSHFTNFDFQDLL